MTIALSTSIEQLVARKGELLREVSEIDAELERAALALNGQIVRGRTAPTKARNFHRDIRVDGSIPNDIYAALAVREPRTIKDLAAHLNLQYQVVYTQCRHMATANRLSRVRIHGAGKAHMYARTESGLHLGSPVVQPETGEAADAEG